MDKLFQKNHGLPGIGVNGRKGETGEKGHSIYFGYINDFFDGAVIYPSSYVYVAARNAVPEKNYDTAVNKINDVLAAADFKSEIQNILDPESYKYYYTGIIYNYDPIYSDDIDSSAMLVGQNIYKIDFANDAQLMSGMLQSANGQATLRYNQSVFPFYDNSESKRIDNNIESIEISVEDPDNPGISKIYKYSTIYDYMQSGQTAKLKDYEHVRMQNTNGTPIVTYDSNDAAYISYIDDKISGFNAKWKFDAGCLSLDYDNVATLLNADLEQVKSPDSVVKAIKEIIPYNNGEYGFDLLTETNSVYATMTDSLKILQSEGTYLNSATSPFDFDPFQYFKTSAAVSKPISSDDITDWAGYAYYGIAGSEMFNNNITYDGGHIIAKSLNTSAFSSAGFPKLAEGLEKYAKNMSAYQSYTRDDIYNDNGYVQYVTHDAVDAVTIPTTLKDEYKAGDIIYFYVTDPMKNKTGNIDYMVVLTEQMQKCTKAQLLKYVQLVSPFNIKYLDTADYRIINTTGVAVTKSNVSTGYDKYITKSLTSIMSVQTDAGIVLSNNDTSGIMEAVAIDTSANKYTLSFGIDSSKLNVDANQLKVGSIYVNKEYDVNAESYDGLYDGNIILENGFIKSIEYMQAYKDGKGNPYIGTVLKASDYFYDITDMSCYTYGYDLMDYKMAVIQHCHTSSITLDMYIPVYTNTKTLYAMVWAASADGIKHYSQLMYIDVECQQIVSSTTLVQLEADMTSKAGIKKLQRTYEYIVSKCDIYVQGKKNQFIKEKPSGNVSYELKSTLTPEKDDGIILDVNVNDDKYELKEVMFDLHNVSAGQTEYVNGWSSVNCSSLTEYVIGVDSNIPGYDTLASYVTSKSDYTYGDSQLFQEIADGKDPVQSKSRSILMTAGYVEKKKPSVLYDASGSVFPYKIYPYDASVYNTKNVDVTGNAYVYYKDFQTNDVIVKFTENVDASLDCSHYYMVAVTMDDDITVSFDTSAANYVDVDSSMRFVRPDVYYENMYITQPGFTDTRDVPDISLVMHNEMADLQSYNTIQHNVKCNQFVTYMDINVNDFNDKWGQFISADTSIVMTFEIKNIISDIEWQKENIIADGIYRHSTVKLCMENDSSDYTQNSNYILLHPSLVKTDKDLIYIDNDYTEYTDAKCSVNTSICLYNTPDEQAVDVSIYDISGYKYVMADASVVECNSHPYFIYDGLQENITVRFDGIGVNEFNDGTLHLKLLYEMGNPMVSSLYLRFAVDNITITVNTGGTETSFKAKVPDILTSDEPYTMRLVRYDSDNDYDYTYMSDPLRVMTNPLSYTVCPSSQETQVTDMSGSLYKEGSSMQIMKYLGFFNSSVYDNALLMDTDGRDIRKSHLFNWSGLKLKKSYLQDNVQNIQVKPANNIRSLNEGNLFKKLCDAEISGYSDILTNIYDSYDYMGIVYNGGIMSPRQRDGIYNFYYNGTSYGLSRYSQYGAGYPVFLNDSVIMQIRDDELFEAVQVWNKEYVKSSQSQKDNTFTGNICLFGNGYTQLVDSTDEGQYEGILSLCETKSQNDVYIHKYYTCDDVYNDDVKTDEPENGGYFRTFLYDLNMEYPMPVSDTESRPYQIVNDFDILLDYLYVTGRHVGKYKDKLENLRLKNNYMVPYTLLYDVYPRVCFNTDNGNANMVMLRMPSIQYDTDIYDPSNYIYSLNKHYFELLAGQSIEKIDGNYKK